MTTKSSGAIIYYNSDGGPITRTVTAADVAALEAVVTAASSLFAYELALFAKTGEILNESVPDDHWRTLFYKMIDALKQLEAGQ